MSKPMRLFAKWHIWLGWIAGLPLLIWTVSGLVMVAKPIEEVRGAHLRREVPAVPLPPGTDIAVRLPADRARPVTAVATRVEDGRVITRLTYADESVERFDADGRKLAPFSDVEARLLVAKRIVGGDQVRDVRLTDADNPPLDFRQPIAAWQVTLADGTHVYVGRDSGEIAAVRTRWWRVFDFFWGLHIMDPTTREDTHHPLLILFTVLALISVLLGITLLFRRRRAPAKPEVSVGRALALGRSPPTRGLSD